MSERRRRIFWGHSLAEAVGNAARYHGVHPDRLPYRPIERKHGFVRIPRRVLIEVDVEQLGAQTGAWQRVSNDEAAPNSLPTTQVGTLEALPPKVAPAAREQEWELGGEEFDAADEEVRLAAHEALLRILRLASFETAFSLGDARDRLEIHFARSETLQGLGIPFLEEVEHLVARAVLNLTGRRVRVTADAGGLRQERERDLREVVEQALVRLQNGRPEVDLGALSPWERWVIHRLVAGDPRVKSESTGVGPNRRLRLLRVDRS